MFKKLFRFTNIMLVLIMFLNTVLLTSCWDKKEINERGFINAIYIEKNITEKKSEMIASKYYTRDREDLFITFGIANTAESEANLKTYTRSVTAATLGDAIEKLDSQTTRTPFFGHTKLIILGRELLKDPAALCLILDEVERSAAIDREVKVIAADNRNIKLENLKSQTESLYSSYISGVMGSADTISYTLSMTMGTLLKSFRENNGRGILPVVRLDGETIKIDKAALINEYATKEIIDARQIRGYKLFQGINTGIREYVQINNILTTFKITSLNRDIVYIKGGDVPKFHIKYKLKGGIENYRFTKQIYTKENEEELETELSYIIKSQLVETAEYFQKKIGIDYLELDDYVEKFYPSEYKKYSKNWNEAFKKAEISYDIDVSILLYGDSI